MVWIGMDLKHHLVPTARMLQPVVWDVWPFVSLGEVGFPLRPAQTLIIFQCGDV